MPVYLAWSDVKHVAQEAGIPASSARKIIDSVRDTDSDPRKYLPGRTKPLYVRCVVLRLFGLAEESPSAARPGKE